MYELIFTVCHVEFTGTSLTFGEVRNVRFRACFFEVGFTLSRATKALREGSGITPR
jgi:hypothetical protein